jgi:excinuclease ABC subunit C
MSNLKILISSLPNSPGVYQFLDAKGAIIYVGKAKSLKHRVSSYFSKNKYDSYKTKVLAKQVVDIQHIVVETEADALLLENNLIKKLQPRYNVLLKDDKTFPWICIKKEPFPRVFSTRKLYKDGSEYYGPYTSALMVKILLNLIRQLYQLRTCNFNLAHNNILRAKYKKCLEFHIGNCKAPCELLQTEEEYENSVQQIRKILKGNIQEVIAHLNQMMRELSSKYKYEDAELIKQKIVLLERYRSKSTIVSPKLNNIDVFAYVEKDKRSYVNFLKIISGAIVQSHTVELINKLQEKKEDLLLFAIYDIRGKVGSTAREIIVPFKLDHKAENMKFIIPKVGDKMKLLELSARNAKQYYIQKQKISDQKLFTGKTTQLLERVKTDLQLKDSPVRIECFDNSNIQGSNPVAACVVFINGKPAKSEYRHFNIKTVVGPDDFASMEEVVFRRYNRLLDEKKDLPQLIVIDGGKGQLNAALKSLKKLNLHNQIAIIGIAKRLEEIFFPHDPIPIYIDKNSGTLKLIQNLRNEAHRFGITFHRDKRSSAMLKNSLEEMKGIGKSTAEKLLRKFGSIEQIKTKSVGDLAQVIGEKKALVVYGNLR